MITSENFTLKYKIGKEKIILDFDEGSTYEALEFIKAVQENKILEYLNDFFSKYGRIESSSKFYALRIRFFGKKTAFEVLEKKYKLSLNKVLEDIKNTRFKGLFDVKEDVKAGESNENIEETIGNVAIQLNRGDPKRLLKNHTWRQLLFFLDRYIYTENEKTEEGRKQNEKRKTEKFIQENKKDIDEGINKILKYLDNKKPVGDK